MKHRYGIWSDPHLVATPKDEYRKKIFQVMRDSVATEKLDVVVINGDLTEHKDNHPASLVNDITDNIASLCQLTNVWLLMGNHDGIDYSTPFFKYLRHLPNFRYFNTITEFHDAGEDILMLPHTRTPEVDWKKIKVKDKLVFAHITVDGAFAESGQKMESSISSKFFDGARVAISGDIHKPQVCNNLTYVGAPYNIRYGDNFEGRWVVYDANTCIIEPKSMGPGFPRKLTFDVGSPEDLEQKLQTWDVQQVPDALVKVRLHLTEQSAKDWRENKEKIAQLVTAKNWAFDVFEMPRDDLKLNVDENVEILDKTVGRLRAEDDWQIYCRAQQIAQELQDAGKEVIASCQ